MHDTIHIAHNTYHMLLTSYEGASASTERTTQIRRAATASFLRSSKHGNVLQLNTLQGAISLELDDLRDENYIIQQPIPVTLQLTANDEFLAVVDHTSIAMTGSSASEALSLLREHIVAVYDILVKERLSPELQKQLRILEAYVAKKKKPTTTT